VLKHEDILEELKVDLVEKKSAHYKQKRLNHVSRMEDIRHPPSKNKTPWLWTYRIKKKTRTTIKESTDGYNREAEAGHLLA